MPGPDELDLALIAGAARAAGEIARGYWRKSPKVWDKGEGHGPVTEADLAINGMLEARLRGARPQLALVQQRLALVVEAPAVSLHVIKPYMVGAARIGFGEKQDGGGHPRVGLEGAGRQ